MTKCSIIVAFSVKKNCTIITNILKNNGISYSCAINTAPDVRKMCMYYERGIIICGHRLIEDIKDFSDRFSFILVGQKDIINMYDTHNMQKLITPIKSKDLVSSIYISMQNMENMTRKEQNIVLEKAKKILFLKYNMKEEKAHKYIQKMSMKYGKKSIEVANMIIKNF